MSTVQWRPYINALTTPRSYKPQVIPRDTIGYKELAEEISRENPLWSTDLVDSILRARDEKVMEMLINGKQVSLENSFTYHLTLSARLDAPDAPLPPAEECVRVKVYAARAFVEEVQQKVQLERLAPIQKAPVIAGAQDTVLRLDNVLNPQGLLRLTGTDLFFDPDEADTGCVIEGTRNGKVAQTRFGSISNSEVQVIPDIPAQNDPWNNEYQVSVMTHYTEHGSLRTGTYGRPLRTPLAVTLGNGDGILSGANRNPLVTVSGGDLEAESAQVRIQAVLDSRSGELRLSLLDMQANGVQADTVTVNGNGPYILPDLAGSGLSGLEVNVQNAAGLEELVRTNYSGRMVDILNVQAGA
ncbi:hypothetical protein [Candidatus Electrothrix sp.]|uniref:hypothetical protein n=1 Tax=Candidatus Electrothrix sp. TaxID=2170559 RepID=UPI0040570703